MAYTEGQRAAQSERMRLRWAERREEMLGYLRQANSPESAGRRNTTRWTSDRDRMTAVASANARRGTEALTGVAYSAERSARASQGQIGKVMTGRGARAPEHVLAVAYDLRSPDGRVHRGTNVHDFVRTHTALFDDVDAAEIAGGYTRAARALLALRRNPKRSWKGWRWIRATSPMKRAKDISGDGSERAPCARGSS